jgi:hypothetical protein
MSNRAVGCKVAPVTGLRLAELVSAVPQGFQADQKGKMCGRRVGQLFDKV